MIRHILSLSLWHAWWFVARHCFHETPGCEIKKYLQSTWFSIIFLIVLRSLVESPFHCFKHFLVQILPKSIFFSSLLGITFLRNKGYTAILFFFNYRTNICTERASLTQTGFKSSTQPRAKPSPPSLFFLIFSKTKYFSTLIIF